MAGSNPYFPKAAANFSGSDNSNPHTFLFRNGPVTHSESLMYLSTKRTSHFYFDPELGFAQSQKDSHYAKVGLDPILASFQYFF